MNEVLDNVYLLNLIPFSIFSVTPTLSVHRVNVALSCCVGNVSYLSFLSRKLRYFFLSISSWGKL